METVAAAEVMKWTRVEMEHDDDDAILHVNHNHIHSILLGNILYSAVQLMMNTYLSTHSVYQYEIKKKSLFWGGYGHT